jgi:CubicO group peptidase (beta-lactamase class C family)
MRKANFHLSLAVCPLLIAGVLCTAVESPVAAAPKSKPLSRRAIAAVDEAVEAEMQRQQLVGVAIGIIRDGVVVLTKGYGFADFENQVPVTTRTVFNWASNSKPLTAVAAMQLVQEKKLDLDADVRKYVSEFAPHGPPITVRQLLCHQSGLPHWANGRVVPSPDLDAEAMESIDPRVTVRRFSQTPLLFEPGSRFSYSSYGYILLSAAIEQAGGESFYVQIEKRIARPLGLESLQLDMAENHADWAVGYTRAKVRVLRGQSVGTPVGRAPDYAHAWKAGAGAFKSNIEDFAKWAAALINGRLVSKSVEKEMWTPQKTSDGKSTEMSLGFFTGEWGGSPTITHPGDQPEASSHLALFLKPRNGIVVLCNCGYGKPAEISRAVATAIGEP